MKEKIKETNKLNIRKLKFIKETTIKHDVQFGGCTASSACWTRI